MGKGARTPEDLELLLEDAFVLRDPDALAKLFEEEALLVTGDGQPEARGREAIAHLAATVLDSNRTYVAEPRRVLQKHDTALVLAERGINVVRRGSDGTWRCVITLLCFDDMRTTDDTSTTKEE